MSLARIQSDWMNTKEVSEYLGISKRSVERLANGGKLPSHKPKHFNRRFYLKSEIDEYLKSN